ncbi:hybrid sensor histidine kinase/response regulator [Desulfonatronum thiodismutans]|uniref:hybrid sensor histidine kinase/response regulator n=1 Tax=Desulfonatronum thiodismutans TaxID=159290 RepID=UPI00068A66C3|nr:response regulator [Desulfonatronum thiodismutans]
MPPDSTAASPKSRHGIGSLIREWWRGSSIGVKFAAIMAFMLLLIMLTALTGGIALRTALSHVKSVIVASTDIRELTLEIDRELQYARQLERGFFQQWPRVGFSQAMKSFGEPLQLRIDGVIALTDGLRGKLDDPAISQDLRDAVLYLDFYLSAAKHYAETFAESVLLVSELAKEDTGRQTTLLVISDVLVERMEMLQRGDLLLLFRTAQTWQNRYLATRQRSDMQSALNLLRTLEDRLHVDEHLPNVSRSDLLNMLQYHAHVSEQILELDRQLEERSREFDLRIYALTPISEQLIFLARQEVDRAWQSIDKTNWNATMLLLAAVICAVLLGLTSALVMHRSISRKFAVLTVAADQIRGGNLRARAEVRSSDEIGRLAETFNTMAERIAKLMHDLQRRVEMGQSRLFQGIESIEEGFALFDKHGRLVVANRNATRMFPALESTLRPGISFQECLSVIQESGVLPHEQSQGANQSGRQAKRVERHLDMFRLGVGTEEIRISEERILRVRYSRAANGETVVLLEDVTERARMQEQRLEMERRLFHSQKLESLGVMAGGIAHDFNNLLAAMMGNMELALSMSGLTEPSRKRVEHALLAARRAADLTRQMLAYSGKGGFDVRSVVLNDLVRDNAHIFQTALGKNVRFVQDLASSLPPIRADAGQIQQVIMNLITNASEAIGDHPGTMVLSTRLAYCDAKLLGRSRLEEKPAPGWFVQLEVQDTGVGMSEDVQSKLFDPFFSTKFTGRGLGLSAVLGIVRGHRGAIIVDSTPDSGTTFHVLFPVDDALIKNTPVPEPSPAPSPAVEPQAAVSSDPELILVVDDEEMVRDLSVEALGHLGYAVLTANDGVEAVRVFQEHHQRIACVLLDLMMPNMDGVTAFTELRKIAPDVPVVLCSGYSSREAEQRFAADRPGAFLQKPFSIDALRRAILDVLENRNSSRG